MIEQKGRVRTAGGCLDYPQVVVEDLESSKLNRNLTLAFANVSVNLRSIIMAGLKCRRL